MILSVGFNDSNCHPPKKFLFIDTYNFEAMYCPLEIKANI
jgi:hypothetical protein